MTIALEDFRKLVAVQLGLEEVRAEDRILYDLGAESFDVLNLVSSLEERYGIQFEDEELAEVDTVADFFHLTTGKIVTPPTG